MNRNKGRVEFRVEEASHIISNIEVNLRAITVSSDVINKRKPTDDKLQHNFHTSAQLPGQERRLLSLLDGLDGFKES